MALVEGTGFGGSGISAAERKRRKEAQEAQFKQARALMRVTPDAEGRAGAVAQAYFHRTGKLPSPEKLVNFTAATAGAPLETQADYDDLFPDWIQKLGPDPDDLKPHQIIPKTKLSVAKILEKKGTGQPYWDTEGLGLNQTYSGRSEADKWDIAFGEMSPAQLAKSFPHSAAQWFYQDEKALYNYARRVGIASDDLMDLSRLMPVRDRLFDIKASEIKDKDDMYLLWDIWSMMDQLYPDEDVTRPYGNDMRNLRWDDQLDYLIARYVVEGNLAHAVLYDAMPENMRTPEMLEKRNAARGLIAQVTENIEVGDDLYKMVQSLGITGDSSEPIQASDQYAEYLFYGYSNARKAHWTDQQVIWQYVQEFGAEFLPAEPKHYYEAVMEDGWNDAFARMEELTGEPLSHVDPEKPQTSAYLYALASQVAGLRDVKGDEWDTVEKIVYKPHEAGLTEPVMTGMGFRGKAPTGHKELKTEFEVQQEEILAEGGIGDANIRDALFTVIPQVVDVEERLTEPMGLFDRYEKGVNRLFLTLFYLDDAVTRQEKQRGIVDPSTQMSGALPWDVFSGSNMKEAWELAGKRVYETDEEHAYMQEYWDRVGWDREEHHTLFLISAYSWSIAKDVVIDLATTGGYKSALSAGTRIFRAVSEPGWIAGRAAATTGLKAAELRYATAVKSMGTQMTPEISAAREALFEAQGALAKFDRPLWHDLLATALAKGEQDPTALAQILRIKTAGEHSSSYRGVSAEARGVWERGKMLDETYASQTLDTVERIAKSRDPVEIQKFLDRLVGVHQQKIDMGAVYWMKAARLANADHGKYFAVGFRHAVNRAGRFDPAYDDVLEQIDHGWRLMNGGLPKTPAGRKLAADTLQKIEKEVWEIGKRARTEVEYTQEAAALYKRMEGLVEVAMKRPLPARLSKQANHFARLAGLPTKVNTYWDLYHLQNFLAAAKRTRGRVFKKLVDTRMYDPQIDGFDDLGRAIIKERSVAVVKREELRSAAKLIYRAKKALKEQRALQMRGIGNPEGVRQAKQILGNAKTHYRELKATKTYAVEHTPFLEEQLAKHVYMKLDPLRIGAANSGSWRNVIEALQGTGWFHGVGPTVNGTIGLFRFVALARMGFVLTALGIDEFWRPQNLRGLTSRVLEPGKTAETKAFLTKRGWFRREEANEITGLMSNTDTWTAYAADSIDYPTLLNAQIAQLQNPTETGMIVFREIGPRAKGESVEHYVAKLRSNLRERVLGDSDDSQRLRYHLIQMRRLNEGALMSPEEVATLAQSKTAALEQARVVVNRLNEDYMAAQLLRRDARAILGNPGKPSTEFQAGWLTERNKAQIAAPFVDEPVTSGRVEGAVSKQINKLEKKFGLSTYTPEELAGFRVGYSREGVATYVVKPDGEIAGITRIGGRPGQGQAAVVDAVEYGGGDHLDCFAYRRTPKGKEILPTYYGKMGFVEYKREPFNPEYAPDWWDVKVHGTPDVVYMRLDRGKFDAFVRRNREHLDELRGEGFARNFRVERGRTTGAGEGGLRYGEAPPEVGAGLTDEQVIAKFGKDLTPQEKKAMQAAWQRQRASETEGGLEVLDTYERAKAAEAVHYKEFVKAKRDLRRAEGLTKDDFGTPGFTDAFDDWVDEWFEKLGGFMQDEDLLAALQQGRHLSKGEIKAITARVEAKGGQMPVVVGSNTRTDWGTSLPLLGPLSEKAGIGPFWWLEQGSEFIRRGTVMHYFRSEYDRLIKAGFNQERAVGRAYAYAEEVASFASYTHTMTGVEYATRNILLFGPAYRQAAFYWGKLAAKHPAIMGGLNQKFATDFPSLQFGPISMFAPFPFWLQENFKEMGIPGFSPFIVVAAKGANMATGWSENEEGMWEYTGATELDFLEEFPGMTFAAKNTSATFQIDDILWAFVPELLEPNAKGTRLAAITHSMFWMSVFKDPIKRRQLANNIARAQISKGMRPDYDAAIEEMRKSDLLWRIASIGGVTVGGGRPVVQNPEALIGLASRMFNPFGRVSYMPEELSEDGKPFYEKIWGDDVRSMSDFYYALGECYGDKEKMQELYDRFPKAAELKAFYDKDVEERIAWISEPKNLWAVPYVTGRNDYRNGRPLIGGEYWLKVQNDEVLNKPLYGEGGYLESIEHYWATLGWTKTRAKIDRDADRALVSAEKIAQRAIKAMATTPEQAEDYQKNWEAYRDGYSDPEKAGEYEGEHRPAPFWLTLYIKEHNISDVMKWNVEAINNRRYRAYKTAGYYFTDEGVAMAMREEREDGYTPSVGGLTDWYTNDIWRASDDYNLRTGATFRVTDEMKRLASPQYRRLFDWEESVSAPVIAQSLEKRKSYQDRILKDICTREHYYLDNPGEQLTSIGMDIDIYKTNAVYYKLDTLYRQYQKKLTGVKEGSSEYKAIRAVYLADREKLYDLDGGDFWRDGIGGRILHSQLAIGPGGSKIAEGYLKAVAKQMAQETPDVSRIVDVWVQRAVKPEADYLENQNKVRRAAWASVAYVGSQYRREMMGLWNETMGSYGISPDASSTQTYVNRLQRLVDTWRVASPQFAEEWDKYMGKYGVSNLLDANF